MSRPRKPFGSTQRGRLPATMIRVLAAEMSDPQRHRRGKRYAADGSVLDITIEPGIVTCEVQGSRPTPYVASLLVRRGDGMPLRRDVQANCTCPDDNNFDGHACKHVIAAMYAFSDELMIEPELLDLWRDAAAERPDGEHEHDDEREDERDDDGHADHDLDDRLGTSAEPSRNTGDGGRAARRRRHLTLVSDRSRTEPEDVSDDDAYDEPPAHDALADQLAAPAGSSLPPLPALAPFDQPAPTRPELAEVLRDALVHVRVEWD